MLSLGARYRRLVLFFARILLSAIFWDILLRNLGFRSLSRRTVRRRYSAAARRFRALAIRMGGVLIKVGQFLSARVDVLPEYITSELSGLQDEVPPEDFTALRQVLESELRGKLGERFAAFDEVPLAAASLGQAHRAALPTGERVVVKIQRPKIQAIVETDLAVLRTVASWLRRYRPIARRADVDALLAEFSRVLREEMDYVAEAGNALRFAEMFAGDPEIRVPRVYPTHSTRRVLTLEDVYFIKITDYEAITAAGVDRSEVADRLLKTYLRQIFMEGFFHADPHPGNLFVEPPGGLSSLNPTLLRYGDYSGLNGLSGLSPRPHSEAERGDAPGIHSPTEWRLVFVDFGMVGRISEETKAGLREAAIAVGTRDAARLVKAYAMLDVLLPTADLKRVEEAESAIFDAFWGKSMGELRRIDPREYRRLASEFRDLLYELPYQIPEDLIFLGRCVAILSGMCTGLNPNFNLFDKLAPFAMQLLAGAGKGGLDYWIDQLLEVGRVLLALPGRLDRTLYLLERGDLELQSRSDPQLLRRLDRATRALNRLALGVLLTGLLISAPLAYQAGQPTLGLILLLLAIPTGLWLIFGLLRK